MIENRAVAPVNFTNVQPGLPNWAMVEKCCFSQVVKKSLFMINAFPCFPPPTIVTARQVPKGMELEAERRMLESLFELSALFHSGKCNCFWRNCCFFIENTVVSVVVGCHKILQGYNKVFFLCLLAERYFVTWSFQRICLWSLTHLNLQQHSLSLAIYGEHNTLLSALVLCSQQLFWVFSPRRHRC